MDAIKKLQDLFSQFPTVGRRTASRFVFYLISLSPAKTDELIKAIQEVKRGVKLCSFCYNPFEPQGRLEGQLCAICQNHSQKKPLLCIVEKEADLISLDNTKKYPGFYFILGGVISLRKNSPEDLRIDALKERIIDSSKFGLPKLNFTEIIIALNSTPEGRATSALVEHALKELSTLKPLTFKLTRLAQGLPVGGELEYADEETLESAFEGRK